MTAYQSLLAACVAYLEKHGCNMETIEALESRLPGCWACELSADAVDIVQAKKRKEIAS